MLTESHDGGNEVRVDGDFDDVHAARAAVDDYCSRWPAYDYGTSLGIFTVHDGATVCGFRMVRRVDFCGPYGSDLEQIELRALR